MFVSCIKFKTFEFYIARTHPQNNKPSVVYTLLSFACYAKVVASRNNEWPLEGQPKMTNTFKMFFKR